MHKSTFPSTNHVLKFIITQPSLRQPRGYAHTIQGASSTSLSLPYTIPKRWINPPCDLREGKDNNKRKEREKRKERRRKKENRRKEKMKGKKKAPSALPPRRSPRSRAAQEPYAAAPASYYSFHQHQRADTPYADSPFLSILPSSPLRRAKTTRASSSPLHRLPSTRSRRAEASSCSGGLTRHR